MRYSLTLLLTIALWAKLTGATSLRAIAEWARERQGELAARSGLPRPHMPHPTTWSRVFGSAVALDALEHQLALLLAPPLPAEEPRPAAEHLALDGKTLRGTIPRAVVVKSVLMSIRNFCFLIRQIKTARSTDLSTTTDRAPRPFSAGGIRRAPG